MALTSAGPEVRRKCPQWRSSERRTMESEIKDDFAGAFFDRLGDPFFCRSEAVVRKDVP
jgi:hypothetical protein